MRISLIAAMGDNRVIGRGHAMPWHLPADLKHFQALTLHKPVVMGRTTFESIGKPLPQRQNIVLTHQRDLRLPGSTVVHSVEEAIRLADPCEELMIAGGASVYDAFLPHAHRMYLTFIDAYFEGDCYFPAYDEKVWHAVDTQNHLGDDRNPYAYRFVTLER